MGWWDRIREQTKELFGGFGQKPDIQELELTLFITMLGYRATGKTTLLAALWQEFTASDRRFGLQLLPAPQTESDLEERVQELRMIASTQRGALCPLGIMPSTMKNICQMQLYVANVKARMNLVFNDYPGEWLASEKGEIKKMLEDSKLIFVTVDAPALMTLEDYQHEMINKTDGIFNSLNHAVNGGHHKLVVFCVVRGEKWIQNGEGELLTRRLKERFHKAFNLLKDHQNTVSVTICPVQTVGCVQFDGWEELVGVKPGELPLRAQFVKTGEGGYAPVDCDQPLRHLLALITHELEGVIQAEKDRTQQEMDSQGNLGRLKRGLFGILGKDTPEGQKLKHWIENSGQLRQAMGQMVKGCKRSSPFSIVQDPDDIFKF